MGFKHSPPQTLKKLLADMGGPSVRKEMAGTFPDIQAREPQDLSGSHVTGSLFTRSSGASLSSSQGQVAK